MSYSDGLDDGTFADRSGPEAEPRSAGAGVVRQVLRWLL